MSACVIADVDATMKPIDLAALLKVELDLGRCDDLLPKDIVELANEKLSRQPVEGANVKDEAVACREAVRALPISYWSSAVVTKGSNPQEILDRILAKPATAGGFACAVACTVMSPKDIDQRTAVWGGAYTIDGFGVLRPPGAYCTTEHEMSALAKLFKSKKPSEKLGDCTFLVTDRSQPAPGQMLMLCKSNKCNAKLAGLYTPKWCVLAVYHFVDAATEAGTLAVLEEMRIEAFGA
mmetsp:Transcript_8787/g.14600  ORF Transcript_8787/g.14600 Transcript_8787/m.14600 type:complete len:237 (-) Transcript_8787:321-1031(-)|eukprot:CAMPEP_0119010334 /NCGR_PEP_ID=MMETSP1176-20130426/4944_1 /TAXON_ID=265551 /ORGANISM="Synedropsis recta cf, Strain CCMP1620" /LENGTH=236 /DNA_ID=CAMNT_0006962971 /DNA_START=95 /DNA_END=805 /DNA_ORIENTATION=-